MKRARINNQEHEIVERATKRGRIHDTQASGPVVEPWHGTSQTSSPKAYRDTVARDDTTVVVGDNYGTLVTHHHHPVASKELFHILLESLAFDHIHARLRNVAQALPDTCQWIFQHQHFATWSTQCGFLWIKGKPGSGKSTILKEIYSWAEKTWSTHCVLSYFFNARSPSVLEKSPLGLYRSLLHQLLSKCSASRDLFVASFCHKVKSEEKTGTVMEGGVAEEWTEIELQNFLSELLVACELPAISVFIDALDEGQDDDVRCMIRYFERLTRRAPSAEIRICFSSRHYPNVTVRTKLSIVVEDQDGHTKDIEKYISSELLTNIDDPDAGALKDAILSRSGGVFLWVVLVISMLNKVYDHGGGMDLILQKLYSIPQDLYELFADILCRDAQDLDKCVTLLRWVLFSQRSMRLEELYQIVHYTCDQTTSTECRALPDLDTISRYLLNCSHGLTELTKSEPPVVQFIHETVRECLLTTNIFPASSLSESESVAFDATISHTIMAETCLEYVLSVYSFEDSVEWDLRNSTLLTYTARNWMWHVSESGISYSQKLVRLALVLLMKPPHFETWFGSVGKREFGLLCDDPLTPLHCAAIIGMPALVSGVLLHKVDINAQNRCRGTALQAAAEEGHEAVVKILLEAGADAHQEGGSLGSPLQAAAWIGHQEILKVLLDSMADVNSQSKYGYALHLASSEGHEKIIRMLLESGADVNSPGADRDTPLSIVTRISRKDLVRMMLDHGADPNAGQGHITALQIAAKQGSVKIVQMLLKSGADPNVENPGNTPLLRAFKNKKADVLPILLKAGARISDSEEGEARSLIPEFVLKDSVTPVWEKFNIVIAEHSVHIPTPIHELPGENVLPMFSPDHDSPGKTTCYCQLPDHAADTATQNREVLTSRRSLNSSIKAPPPD